MSLFIEFEPHSWYKEFAIKKESPWYAVTANGMTGYLVEFDAYVDVTVEYNNLEQGIQKEADITPAS